MLRKIIMLVAGFTIAMGIAACQQKQDDTANNDENATQTEESTTDNQQSSLDNTLQTASNTTEMTAVIAVSETSGCGNRCGSDDDNSNDSDDNS